jgi:hypothetical protein
MRSWGHWSGWRSRLQCTRLGAVQPVALDYERLGIVFSCTRDESERLVSGTSIDGASGGQRAVGHETVELVRQGARSRHGTMSAHLTLGSWSLSSSPTRVVQPKPPGSIETIVPQHSSSKPIGWAVSASPAPRNGDIRSKHGAAVQEGFGDWVRQHVTPREFFDDVRQLLGSSRSRRPGGKSRTL